MALVYLDTGVLVNRYLPEVGLAWVARLSQQDSVVISLVVITGLASTLARRVRECALSAEQRDTLSQAFLRDAQTLTVIEPSRAIA